MKKLVILCSIIISILTFLLPKDILAVNNQLPKVIVTTNLGQFVIEVDTRHAPKTAGNFLFYVKSGYYNGTIFHRVINGFMIQGGGFTPAMQEKKPIKKPLRNEAGNGLLNDIYTIAMARTNDPHSATTQFFINVANNKNLNYKAPTPEGYGYTVFGKIISGQDVINQIRQVSTHRVDIHDDVPVKPVIIESMRILSDETSHAK